MSKNDELHRAFQQADQDICFLTDFFLDHAQFNESAVAVEAILILTRILAKAANRKCVQIERSPAAEFGQALGFLREDAQDCGVSAERTSAVLRVRGASARPNVPGNAPVTPAPPTAPACPCRALLALLPCRKA